MFDDFPSRKPPFGSGIFQPTMFDDTPERVYHIIISIMIHSFSANRYIEILYTHMYIYIYICVCVYVYLLYVSLSQSISFIVTHNCAHKHTHTHICVYLYIYIYLCIYSNYIYAILVAHIHHGNFPVSICSMSPAPPALEGPMRRSQQIRNSGAVRAPSPSPVT